MSGVSLRRTAAALALAAVVLAPAASPGAVVAAHAGEVAFRFDGRTSSRAFVDWIAYLAPVAAYNAHRDAWILGANTILIPTGGEARLSLPNAEEAAAARIFRDGAPAAGPLHPTSASRRPVRAGDALIMTKGNAGGVANPVLVRITPPDGEVWEIEVRFPCDRMCEVAVDLNRYFGGRPSDGTWVIEPGINWFL